MSEAERNAHAGEKHQPEGHKGDLPVELNEFGIVYPREEKILFRIEGSGSHVRNLHPTLLPPRRNKIESRDAKTGQYRQTTEDPGANRSVNDANNRKTERQRVRGNYGGRSIRQPDARESKRQQRHASPLLAQNAERSQEHEREKSAG